MTTIRDCIAPDRNPKVPSIKLPEGSIDTHVHIFESQYPLFEGRGYNPPDSTLDDLKHFCVNSLIMFWMVNGICFVSLLLE